jgi:D-alanyl-D-alanine carboxypeptidase
VGSLEKLSVTDPELLQKYSKTYFLNEHYVPISLSQIPIEYTNTSGKNLEIHSDVLPFLEDMLADAKDAGLSLQVLSAYRSFYTQAELKASYIFTYGAGTANKFSAEQGYSEHQLGTTMDFTNPTIAGVLSGFDTTPEYKWLLENAYKYGFVISYPEGNTYYKFEPWHFRFVGIKLATKLYEDNMYFYNMDQRVINTYLPNIFDKK